MSRRRALLTQVAGGFDPLTYGAPIHAFWAENPAQVLSGTVTSWTNSGASGVAALLENGSPSYVASAINGRPAIEFDGSSDLKVGYSTVITKPGAMVAVAQPDTLLGDNNIIDGQPGYRWGLGEGSGSWQAFAAAATTMSGGTPVAGEPVLLVADISTSGIFRVNGMQVFSGNSSTSGNDLQNLFIGSQYSDSDFWDGMIAFVAIYDAEITTESWFSEYEDGLIDHYGIT